MHVTPYNVDTMTIAKYNEPYTGPSGRRSAAGTGSVDMICIDSTLLRVQSVGTGNGIEKRATASL